MSNELIFDKINKKTGPNDATLRYSKFLVRYSIFIVLVLVLVLVIVNQFLVEDEDDYEYDLRVLKIINPER